MRWRRRDEVDPVVEVASRLPEWRSLVDPVSGHALLPEVKVDLSGFDVEDEESVVKLGELAAMLWPDPAGEEAPAVPAKPAPVAAPVASGASPSVPSAASGRPRLSVVRNEPAVPVDEPADDDEDVVEDEEDGGGEALPSTPPFDVPAEPPRRSVRLFPDNDDGGS